MNKFKITVLPQEKEIFLSRSINLLQALQKSKIDIPHDCGGKARCGKCKVKIKSGKGYKNRLACQVKVNRSLIVQVPFLKNSSQVKVLTDTKIKSKFKRMPLVERKDFTQGLSLILDHDELLAVEKKNKKHIFGLAIDVGTTTICVSLCNLEDGEELASATILNHQSIHGADIISRLDFALKSKENLQILSHVVIFSINKAIDECVQKTGAARSRVFSVVMVGNSVMQHLMFQMPIKSLTTPPYDIAEKGLCQTKAGILKLNINPNANVRFLPSLGGFVGSDSLATILSLRLFKKESINLCVDLGTNGEIILGSGKGMVVASTAAGSAFEGYHIKCGMVAKAGAIEWMRIDKGEVRFQTIGHINPKGICGSGIIDIVSELLKEQVIDYKGKMDGKSFLIYKDKNNKIELTEKDVRELQLAKAAVFTGIQILMKKMKIKPEQIKNVFLAGALGNYLNAKNAIRIGLIPSEFEDRIDFVGNTAFLGAKLVLLSKTELLKALKLPAGIKHISLAEDKNFQNIFVNALHFPATLK